MTNTPTCLGVNFHDILSATRPQDDDNLGLNLRCLARRIFYLNEAIDLAEARLNIQTTQIAPALTATNGIKAIIAAELLDIIGENPDRIPAKEAFVALCIISPIPVSSGKTHGHRINFGGD